MHKEEKGSLEQPGAGPSRHPFLLLLIKSVSPVEATIEDKQQRHNAEAPFNVNYFIVKSPLLSTGEKRERKKHFQLRCCFGTERKKEEKNCHCVISINRGSILGEEGGRLFLCTTLVDYISFITHRSPSGLPSQGQDAGVTVNTIRPGQIPSMGRIDERGQHRNNQQSALITTATRGREGEGVYGGGGTNTLASSNVNCTRRLPFSSFCGRSCRERKIIPS